MTWSNFLSYYYTTDATVWCAWDPTLKHRKVEDAKPYECVNIEETAKKYEIPDFVGAEIDKIITKEIYDHLISPDLDENFLKKSGFKIIKNSGTRVITHLSCPNWLIKIGKGEIRRLPMESKVKIAQAKKENRTDPWISIRNSNLMRAAGRNYFVNQLANLDPKVSRHFEFPQEYIYSSPHANQAGPTNHRFFSISERKNIYSGKETLEFIKDQSVETQRLIAQKIISFITIMRIHDLHPGNIVLNKDSKKWSFVIIDTEPLGILIDEKDPGAHLFDPTEHVLFGLISFRDYYCCRFGLTAMAEVADQAIVDYIKEHNELSVKTDFLTLSPNPATSFQIAKTCGLIFASVLCPLIPLILLIISIFARIDGYKKPHPCEKYDFIHKDTPGKIYIDSIRA